ncbi:hypothetical protein GLOIN_2v1786842 [Rhizophagus irregularis DAOM 181602=DAOM 197198]|nr:hypothetical protein GLOIN_2v1786842 [Rhizophagus irregularis DAOM 181602=DAOM 197198]
MSSYLPVKNFWLKHEWLKLSNESILEYHKNSIPQWIAESEISDIPRDILDDSDENNAKDDEVDDSGNNKRAGKGDYDYDIDDVLGMNDGDNNDDNYNDNEK